MALDFEVVDLPEADPPAEGTQAPDFVRPLVNDEYREDRSLSELTADGPLLLVFYTMDGGGSAAYLWDRIRNCA
jgi:hypothetical protein